MPNERKTIVITGGTGGIGLQTAIGLAKEGHRIVVTGRDRERGEVGVERIKAIAGNDDVHLVLGDLAQGADVARLASELCEAFPKIDVLINNAGMIAPELTYTGEGFELNFAVNVVAPLALTQGLLPSLQAASPARVINVTGGRPGAPFDVDYLDGSRGFVALTLYDATKRAMEAAALVQAEDLRPKEIYLNFVFPGSATTSMTKAVKFGDVPWFMKPFWPLFKLFVQRDDDGKSAEKASRSSVWAASAPETIREVGVYYDNKCKRAELHPTVHDAANQQRVLDHIHRIQSRSESGER